MLYCTALLKYGQHCMNWARIFPKILQQNMARMQAKVVFDNYLFWQNLNFLFSIVRVMYKYSLKYASKGYCFQLVCKSQRKAQFSEKGKASDFLFFRQYLLFRQGESVRFSWLQQQLITIPPAQTQLLDHPSPTSLSSLILSRLNFCHQKHIVNFLIQEKE